MRKTDRRTGREQSSPRQPRLPLRGALFDTVVVSGLEYVGKVLEEERTELCGCAIGGGSSAGRAAP